MRKAASVIAARNGRQGLEVLVLQRSHASRFLPGYVVFPGGASDEDDARHAERWFGSAEEATRACAVRELLEEAGLALTGDGLGEAGDRSVEELVASPPRLEQLPQIAHWIAPIQVPVRFDARFYAVEAPDGLGAEPDGTEIVGAWWASPQRLLDEWREQRHKLYWPTYFTIRAVAECSAVSDLLELRLQTREPDEDEMQRLPRSTFWQA